MKKKLLSYHGLASVTRGDLLDGHVIRARPSNKTILHLWLKAARRSKPFGQCLCVPIQMQLEQASFMCILHMQAPHPIALAILVLGAMSISEPAGISL